VSAATSAASVGSLVYQSSALDSTTLGFIGISGLSAKGVKTKNPTLSGDWWSTTESISAGGVTISYSMHAKITDVNGTVINSQALLDALSLANTDRVDTYGTLTITTTVGTTTATSTMTMGSSSSPLAFTGVGSNSTSAKSVNGTVSFSGSDSTTNTTYSVSLTYSNVTIAASGYPSGTVSFTVSSSSSQVYAGTVTFNGTATATLAFTSGASGTYTVYINTGAVVAASVN